MSDHKLYDDDILLWSEQQAAAIRNLRGARGDLSNELDIENVAEEIESVGRSELAAVKSYLRLVFVHLIKIAMEADSEVVRHWRGEIVAFHSEIIDRYAPSMRQRIDVDDLWRSAREQLLLVHEGAQHDFIAGLSEQSVILLDDLLAGRIDSDTLVERLRRALAPK